MKKLWKLGLIPAAFLVCVSTSSCNAIKKEVALITDVGDIDDGSFNQTSWEAVKAYCGANNKSYDFYRPFADSDYARRCAVKQAVYKGARVIVCPGFKFAPTVASCQKDFPDVHFALLDTQTQTADYTPVDVEMNTVCITFNAEISGYLAGYTTATDYIRQDYQAHNIPSEYIYGFCGGMANDGVFPYGFGFIQGIAAAIKYFHSQHPDFNLPKLVINYNYAGVFSQSDDAAARMKGWYANGTKVVFACGGKLYQSITEGVKDYNRKNNMYDFPEGEAPRNAARWIGVDSDQYTGLRDEHEKKAIITSALKGLNNAIQTLLHYHFLGVWEKAIGGPFSATPDGKQLQRTWVLGLNSEFGRRDTDPNPQYEVERKDYVGIPTTLKKGSDTILRGFNNVTLDEYKDLAEEAGKATAFVYGQSGENLFASADTSDNTPYYNIVDPVSGKRVYDKNQLGNPEFMDTERNVTQPCYVNDASTGLRVKFNSRYLSDYPNIDIKYN